MRYKVIFEHDQDPDLSWLDQWDTPAKYKGNEILDPKTHKALPFAEYMRTYGDPNRHVTLQMLKYEACDNETHCAKCDGWHLVDSLGGIDFMDWDNFFVGSLEYNKADEDTEMLNPHQRELLG